MTIPHENLVRLGDLLFRQPDAENRRFPSVSALLKSRITDDPMIATVARLLWKKRWAYDAIHNLDPEAVEILSLLPNTYCWASRCFNYPRSPEVLREALNELLGFFGVENIYHSRVEGRGADRQVVSTGSLAARYLDGGDPYVTTLIFPTSSGTPYIGCWGEHPEVNK